MKISIVIPAYNEAKNIGLVLDSLRREKFPIVVVDDGSKDKTFDIASKYVRTLRDLTVLRHKVNLGKGAALKTGCESAILSGAEGIIIMDSDGQHRVADLPKFIEVLNGGKYDIVFGSRDINMNMPLVRFIGNKVASALISFLFGIYISDLICGFRAFTKTAYRKLNLKSSNYGIETEMVAKVGKLRLKHCEIPVETVYYDKFKGVTILDALGILFDVFIWKIR
ncbi:MAG: glycosyl transferase family 2 [uncultured bacterium]|uniref:Glycosyl transferase family 2 n=1 Tax=Candidatus Daviesbacteria bacterium GW2011_GWC2_40_12 TaxID=1618431 RepID=A0A0G0QR78_9BACT|nr:MAG: glycosyl transferase family 2 [uncultured bacterium]KKQ83429.1 MAG: Glycosyl transferase family 2 [Candidatus Daviesbacteria bacterium GW2011_GWF2_38_7]KKR17234.1 MAG: Glycosyl transferase family 2 [Candidatus Daviesbacteria bacterium GW2011_GWA2_39_33]KKR42633.1 MAG: Glycosyl transferase family 2 [Candidatus Daviesbacteria bacterium GW2011_GWC2_40_12]OGE21309.1 MAG: hypothetical protein A2778_04030 [Candidatus Daviesbacteria bacterium RIFCSPHIGHO2_01_FULL_40_24]OGE30173.1 MAG: hypothe